MQSDLYKNLDEGRHEWLRCNINPKKASAIINMQERTIETKTLKKNRGIHIDSGMFRLCGKCVEGVIVSRCQMIAGNEHMNRQQSFEGSEDNITVKKGLMEQGQYWYKLKWKQGNVIKNDKVKLC